jgi:hypothetical protein
MQATCVNPDELTKVVVYLPEVKDEDFLRRMIGDLPDKIAEGIAKGLLVGPRPIQESSTPQHKFGWWVGVVLSVFGVIGGLWAGLHYVISSELRAAFEQPNKDFASLRDKEVGGIQKDLGYLRRDVDALRTWQTSAIFTSPGKTSTRGANRPDVLKGAADWAIDHKIVVDPAAIQYASMQLPNNASADSWQAMMSLINLRSYVNSTFAEAKLNIVQTIRDAPGDIHIMPRLSNQWVELDVHRINLGGDISEPNISFDRNNQPLTLLENFIIKGAKVTYRGRKITLVNVFFENCTFDITNEANGQELAKNILALRPFTNFVVN